MENLSYHTLKERLHEVQTFIEEIDPSLSNKDVKSQLENISYFSQALDHISARGEEVKDENIQTFVDGEINKVSKLINNFSCVPTFIVGNRRSGTTLLSALLDSHSSFCSIPENFMANDIASSKEMTSLCAKAFEMGTSPEEFWGVQAKLIDNVYQRFVSQSGNDKKRWVCKEIYNSVNLDKIDYIFDYQPKYIYLVRHGIDVSYSCAKRFPERAELRHQGNFMKGYLQEWVDNNELVMDFYEQNQERCYFIKYEDLVSNPEAELKKLLLFLDEKFEPEIFARMKSQDHPGVTGDHSIYSTGFEIQKGKGVKWENWPEPVKNHLLKIAKNTLRRLNYSV